MLDAVDVLFCFPKNSEFDHTQWKLNFLNTSLELESWYVAWWLPSIQPRAPEHVSIEQETTWRWERQRTGKIEEREGQKEGGHGRGRKSKANSIIVFPTSAS